MLTITPLAPVPVQNRLGEGIVWDDRQDCFRWTDIEGRALFRLDWPSRALSSIALPERLGSFVLTNRPDQLIGAFESGFARIDITNESIDWLVRPDLPPGVRFNDGRAGPDGAFWAATMVEDGAPPSSTGALWRLAPDGTSHCHLTGLGIGNGIAFAPDGLAMYLADSRRHSIDRYQLGAVGFAKAERFAITEPGEFPDGALVDADGRYWSARWAGAAVVVHDVHGHPVQRIALPMRQPTCPALGGPDLDILAVTSATIDLKAPGDHDGCVWLARISARGRLEARFGN